MREYKDRSLFMSYDILDHVAPSAASGASSQHKGKEHAAFDCGHGYGKGPGVSVRGYSFQAVCCSVEDAIAAEGCGAQSIEVCIALSLGGLTPSAGLVQEIGRHLTRTDVFTMLRPRPGGFVYSLAEQAVMERDAERAIECGADGLVFGALTEGGQVDRKACKRIVRIADAHRHQASKPLTLTFHRAFDQVGDPYAAMDALLDLGIGCVLTSGQQQTALAGARLLHDLNERYAGRITLLAGGGIRAGVLREVVEKTGCTAVHLGPRRPVPSSAGVTAVDFGGHDELDTDALAEVARIMESLPTR